MRKQPFKHLYHPTYFFFRLVYSKKAFTISFS